MRILAIDPGYDRLGIAVVEGNPSKPVVIHGDCLVPEKMTHALRLARVSQEVTALIAQYVPDALATETLFFSTNKKTALAVAEARGAILAAAGLASLPVFEYSPQQVKLAVTGHGRADKSAIARMVPRLVQLSQKKRFDDELDAIAIGIAALTGGIKTR